MTIFLDEKILHTKIIELVARYFFKKSDKHVIDTSILLTSSSVV
jgi:hypothetical protein